MKLIDEMAGSSYVYKTKQIAGKTHKVRTKKSTSPNKKSKLTVTNDYCAPCSKGALIKKDGDLRNKKSKTCYSKESLLKIAKAYNLQNPNNKIEDIDKLDQEKLWNIIRNKLSGICGYDEYCWRKLDFVKRLKDSQINLYTFKPKMPEEWKKNRYTWLNTYDILYVMKQYEKLHNDFIFMGVVPSDCPTKINCELSNIEIPHLLNSGIRKMGIIFNLDVSSGQGTHWIGVFSEFNKKKCEIDYYDSNGEEPIPLIKKFLFDLSKNFEKNNIRPTIIYNDRRHQYGNSECGVYSMNFILERLYGSNMYQISKMKILDKDMNFMRQLLYHV